MTLQAIPLPDGQLLYARGFLAPAEAARYLSILSTELQWQQPMIRLFGRTIPSPRLAAWYGDAGAIYRYSGLTHQPLPWTDTLLELRRRVESACGEFLGQLGKPSRAAEVQGARHTPGFSGGLFNSVLANLYRDGHDSMGWHSDDEPELGPEPVIASLSLGATRRFQLRHKSRRDLQTVTLELGDGDLLVMAGTTQCHWQHQIPKTRKPVGPRINLTFRLVEPASGRQGSTVSTSGGKS